MISGRLSSDGVGAGAGAGAGAACALTSAASRQTKRCSRLMVTLVTLMMVTLVTSEDGDVLGLDVHVRSAVCGRNMRYFTIHKTYRARDVARRLSFRESE